VSGKERDGRLEGNGGDPWGELVERLGDDPSSEEEDELRSPPTEFQSRADARRVPQIAGGLTLLCVAAVLVWAGYSLWVSADSSSPAISTRSGEGAKEHHAGATQHRALDRRRSGDHRPRPTLRASRPPRVRRNRSQRGPRDRSEALPSVPDAPPVPSPAPSSAVPQPSPEPAEPSPPPDPSPGEGGPVDGSKSSAEFGL